MKTLHIVATTIFKKSVLWTLAYFKIIRSPSGNSWRIKENCSQYNSLGILSRKFTKGAHCEALNRDMNFKTLFLQPKVSVKDLEDKRDQSKLFSGYILVKFQVSFLIYYLDLGCVTPVNFNVNFNLHRKRKALHLVERRRRAGQG